MNRRAMMMGVAAVFFVASGCAKHPDMSSVSALGAGYADQAVTMPDRPNVAEYKPMAELADVQFDFDKYEIRPDAARVLDKSAKWLKAHTTSLILIEGHCDMRGTSEYNMVLGERRAKATMSYLMSRGVEARRMAVVSYGEDKPVCSQSTEACWAKNRRAHFLAKAE